MKLRFWRAIGKAIPVRQEAAEDTFSAPLSIHPNPEYFVQSEANPLARVCRVIDVSDGGVIGITGERGAGKSVLLNKLTDKYKDTFLTVSLSSPISMSKEMEFFIMLFRHLVQRVIFKLLEQSQWRDNDINSIGKAAIARDKRLFLTMSGLLFGLCALVILAVFASQSKDAALLNTDKRIYELIHEDFSSTRSASAQPFDVSAAKDRNAQLIAQLRNDQASLSSSWSPWAGLKYSKYKIITVLLPNLSAVVAVYLFLAFGQVLRKRFAIMSTASSLERGLLLHSQQLAIKLDYELTRTAEQGLEFSPTSWLKSSAKLSRQEKARALSLPELTASYIDYVADVLQVFPGKLVICIDELDKVADIEQIKFIMREIKGALYVKDTFYILSISNDALRSFEGRMGNQRDIFESTFDDVFPVRSLELSSCIEILKRRIEGGVRESPLTVNNELTLRVIPIFSAGNARDLIRGFRECVLSGQAGVLPAPAEAWALLFARRLESIADRVAVAGGPTDLRELLVPILRSKPKLVEGGSSVFRAARKKLHSYIDAPNQSKKNVTVAQRFLRYSAELEILLKAREALSAPTLDELSVAASYLIDCYQILPFSLEDCESALDRYDQRSYYDLVGLAVGSPGFSPLDSPVSDRAESITR